MFPLSNNLLIGSLQDLVLLVNIGILFFAQKLLMSRNQGIPNNFGVDYISDETQCRQGKIGPKTALTFNTVAFYRPFRL
jgi:hypothetical protein